MEFISAQKGDLIGESPLFYYHHDNSAGCIGIAICRTSTQGSISGSGSVAKIRLKVETEEDLFQTEISHATGIDALGNTLHFEVDREINRNPKTPEAFVLHQNYPNPFNPITKLRYDLPEKSQVTVKVYDLLGTVIITLVEEMREAGSYVVEWDGKNGKGELVTSGIYCFSIKAGKFSCVKKGLLLK